MVHRAPRLLRVPLSHQPIASPYRPERATPDPASTPDGRMPLPPWFIKSGRSAASKTEPCRQPSHQDVFQSEKCVWSDSRCDFVSLFFFYSLTPRIVNLSYLVISHLIPRRKRVLSRQKTQWRVIYSQGELRTRSLVPVTRQGTCVQVCVLRGFAGRCWDL